LRPRGLLSPDDSPLLTTKRSAPRPPRSIASKSAASSARLPAQSPILGCVCNRKIPADQRTGCEPLHTSEEFFGLFGRSRKSSRPEPTAASVCSATTLRPVRTPPMSEPRCGRYA